VTPRRSAAVRAPRGPRPRAPVRARSRRLRPRGHRDRTRPASVPHRTSGRSRCRRRSRRRPTAAPRAGRRTPPCRCRSARRRSPWRAAPPRRRPASRSGHRPRGGPRTGSRPARGAARSSPLSGLVTPGSCTTVTSPAPANRSTMGSATPPRRLTSVVTSVASTSMARLLASGEVTTPSASVDRAEGAEDGDELLHDGTGGVRRFDGRAGEASRAWPRPRHPSPRGRWARRPPRARARRPARGNASTEPVTTWSTSISV
jgi:hypothetical protein